MKAELLMGIVTQRLLGSVSICGPDSSSGNRGAGYQTNPGTVPFTGFCWLCMTPLKLLQVLTGGGNGWESGWIVHGMLLPKAFWIMTVAKKAHCPESSPAYLGHSWHGGGEKALA